jgi:hypothetical protein
MADVHGLGDVRRTEINYDRSRMRGWFEKPVFTSGSGLQRFGQRVGPNPEIKKASARNFDFFADIIQLEFADNVRGELTRIGSPGFSETHERSALVIAELWIGTGADQDARKVGVGKNLAHGFLQALLNC